MKALGVVRGYRIGREYLDFCYEARYSRLSDGKLAFLEPLERDLGGMDAMPELKSKLERLLRKVNLINEKGHLCTQIGMHVLAPLSKPREFYSHVFNAIGVWFCGYEREVYEEPTQDTGKKSVM